MYASHAQRSIWIFLVLGLCTGACSDRSLPPSAGAPAPGPGHAAPSDPGSPAKLPPAQATPNRHDHAGRSGSPPAAITATPPAPSETTAKPEADGSYRVGIDNFTFRPASLRVPVGAKVVWVNTDDVPHTVTSPQRPRTLDSKALDTDDRFEFVFGEPGTFAYYCTVHPRMTGEVVVVPTPSPIPPNP